MLSAAPAEQYLVPPPGWQFWLKPPCEGFHFLPSLLGFSTDALVFSQSETALGGGEWWVHWLAGWMSERMGGYRVNSRRMRSWHVFKKKKKSHNQTPEDQSFVWIHKPVGKFSVRSTLQSCQIASSCGLFVNCLLTIENDFKLSGQWK